MPLIFGATANHAIPALVSPPTLTAVSAAPQRTPFANHVCCIRVSLESSVDWTSSCFGSGGLKSSCQQPAPNGVGVVVLLMHSRSGVFPGFWSERGGNVYVSLLISRLLSASEGEAESIDFVFVSAHSPMRWAVPVWLPVSKPSPAIVLRKYSVPLRSLEYCPACDVAGQAVKPGMPSTARFSTSVTLIAALCAASWAFENAKIWAAL